MKRIIKYIGAIILSIFFILIFMIIGINLYQISLTNELKDESIEALKKAHSIDELKEAIKPWGIFINFKDNSWMAIRYRDVHIFSIPSSAVALDSAGRWYESNYHFCGQFDTYRLLEKQFQKIIKIYDELGEKHGSFDEMMNESLPNIHALVTSSNLLEARKQLLNIHFHEMNVN